MSPRRDPRAYMRVAEDTRALVAGGVLQPGTRLDVPQIAASYGVTVPTACKGLQLLVEEGALARRLPGHGYWVPGGDGSRPSARVADSLRALIIARALPADEPVGMGDLAAKHGVGRHTVREALKALADEGLVVFYPGYGYYVADDPDWPAGRAVPP